MRKITVLQIVGVLLGFSSMTMYGEPRSGSTTLDRPSSARATSLGEAVSAVPDDISALDFNPAIISSLRGKQASLFFERGADQGGFGKVAFGMPMGDHAWGASVGYFTSGSVEIINDSNTSQVEGQRDITAALAAGHRFGKTDMGITAKYLESTLLGTEHASALAADIGLQRQMSSHVRTGVALLNFGSDLKFEDQGDPLSRQARLATLFTTHVLGASLGSEVDVNYLLIDHRTQIGFGLETLVGPLSIRGGLKMSQGDTQIGAGAGFMVGNVGLDYAFSIDQNSDGHHQINLLLKLGENHHLETPSVSANIDNVSSKTTDPASAHHRLSTVYEVQSGDTWASIAEKFLGSSTLATTVQSANHFAGIIDLPPPGRKILIP